MITNLTEVKNLRRRGGHKPSSPDVPSSGEKKNYSSLLFEAQQYYSNLEKFRILRRRSRKYTEGDQWCELIVNPKNKFYRSWIKEEDYIRQDGRIPFKQNIIGQLVTNIIGQYRKNPMKSNVMARARERQKVSEMLSNALQYALKINDTDELDAANLREFVISGFCASKVTYEWNADRQMPEVKIRNRNPNYLFFNTPIHDPRIDPDLHMIGEFYDLTIDEVVSAFAKTHADQRAIRNLF